MLVKEAMSKPVVTIDENQTVLEACNIYKERKIGCLVITDNEKVVGILTERDIIERTICERRLPEKTKVGEIMSSDIKTVHPLDTLNKAIEMMKKFNVKKLPVVSEGKIVGIITVTDISKARPDLSKRFIESWVRPEWRD